MDQRNVFAEVAESMEASIRQGCPTCHRGGVNLPLPTVDDVDSLLIIKRGFDRIRHDFSPQMEARLKSLEVVANYLHIMIAGTTDAS